VDLDVAVDLVHEVAIERLVRRTVQYRAGGYVEPGAVALAHERRASERAAGQRASPVRARAEVVERIEAVVDARDGDPSFQVIK
jgi:hypothetical protein